MHLMLFDTPHPWLNLLLILITSVIVGRLLGEKKPPKPPAV